MLALSVGRRSLLRVAPRVVAVRAGGVARAVRWASSSDDSHSDFAPVPKKTVKNGDIMERIASNVGSDKVVLFMKGTPTSPQCGFSAAVVRVLSELSK